MALISLPGPRIMQHQVAVDSRSGIASLRGPAPVTPHIIQIVLCSFQAFPAHPYWRIFSMVASIMRVRPSVIASSN